MNHTKISQIKAFSGDSPEPSLVIPVRRAERDLLNGLIHDQPFGLFLHNAKTVSAHVQDCTHGTPPGILEVT